MTSTASPATFESPPHQGAGRAGSPGRGPARALLRAAILVYRRRLSGRGPLRRVGCSFAHTESCSAYGLRMVETAPSLAVAVQRIRARLRRCREASIYVSRAPGHRCLAWGCDHDEPEGLDAALASVDELPRTRFAIVDASRRIAAYRGRWELAATLRGQLRELALDVSEGPPRLLIRSADHVIAHRAKRLAVELLACAVLIGLALALAPLAMAAILAAPLVLAAAAAIRRFEQRRRRFERLLAAAAFSTAGRVGLAPVE